jgi:hypothetical protein
MNDPKTQQIPYSKHQTKYHLKMPQNIWRKENT